MTMLPTLNRLEPLVVLSCLQKAIRRADERLAMQCAVELAETSKTYATMTLNRLRIILHEDIDVIIRPELIAAVETTLQQAAAFRENTSRKADVRMLLGTVIRLLAWAPKSREGDHFHVAAGRPVVNGAPLVIPDWAYDKHTSQGRQRGRGLDHFREEERS